MNPVTATLTLDRTAARLSDTVHATVALEGPGPFVVTPPKELLADESAAAWLAAPAGPAAVTKLPGGRERWEQAYRLSPFQPGDPLPVRFAPFEVAAGGGPAAAVELPPREVTVRTVITEANPADARPVTGIEELPPSPDTGPPVLGVAPVVAVAAVVLLAAAAVILRNRRRSPPLPAPEWAARELKALEQNLAADRITTAVFAERLADVLRTYVERRFGLPATRQTTAELLATAGPDLPADAVRTVLDRCDLAKFAGRVPDRDESKELLVRSREALVVQGRTPERGEQ